MWSPDSLDQVRQGQSADIHISAKNVRDFQIDMAESEIEFETISHDLEGTFNTVN